MLSGLDGLQGHGQVSYTVGKRVTGRLKHLPPTYWKPIMQTPVSSLSAVLRPAANESININEEASVNYWLAALRCSEFELRVAVAEVGTGAKDVGFELGRAL